MKNSIIQLLQRKDLLALAALVLITLAVRIPGVYSRAIWYDEAVTLLETAGHPIPDWSEEPTPAATQKAFFIGTPSLGEINRGLRKTDVHPPAYYSLLSIWRRIGSWSIESARLFSVFCSIGSVILLFLLLRASGFARPFVPCLVYSLSSGAVHYGHETRSYALAMFFVLAAALLSYVATTIERDQPARFAVVSLSTAVCCGLAFQTNYLSVFPVLAILLGYLIWTLPKWRLFALPAIVIAGVVSLANLPTLMTQLGARPHQFKHALGFGQELAKILDFNFVILWNPVPANPGLRVVVIATLLLLVAISVVYVKSRWMNIDRRLFSLMVGLAFAPSVGLLILDLAFNKNLGKPSYVLLAGPAVVVLLTLSADIRSRPEPGESWHSAAWPVGVFVYALPFFIGLQMTGINYGRELTPGFAGSTRRSLAARIEASSPAPLVIIGAGHGRGDPATLIYELKPETTVCVIYRGTELDSLSSEVAAYDDVWMVFATGAMTRAVEQEFFGLLTGEGSYRVVSQTKRFAHLKKAHRILDDG